MQNSKQDVYVAQRNRATLHVIISTRPMRYCFRMGVFSCLFVKKTVVAVVVHRCAVVWATRRLGGRRLGDRSFERMSLGRRGVGRLGDKS